MKKKLSLYNKNSNHGDYFLLIAVVLLSLIGMIFIYSASNYSAKKTYGDAFYFVKKQAIGVLLGIVAMISASLFDYNKLKKLVVPVSIISFLTLLLVFVPGIGIENYGAKRWIGFGGITLQPSEIAKFSLILFISTYVSKRPERMNKFIGVLPALFYGSTT